jgi:hypothetical protein
VIASLDMDPRIPDSLEIAVAADGALVTLRGMLPARYATAAPASGRACSSWLRELMPSLENTFRKW